MVENTEQTIEINMLPTEEMKRGFVDPDIERASETSPINERMERPDRQYIPTIPWDIRLHRWIRSWVITPHDMSKDNRWLRIARIKFWLFGRTSGGAGVYERFRQMSLAIVGGKVRPEVFVARMEECMKCPKMQIRVPSHDDGKWNYYCGSCSCPRWWLSELHKKNKLRRWNCPERKHPGLYTIDNIRRRINQDRERRGV